MKLTAKERKFVEMMRELDEPQRRRLLGDLSRGVLANRITMIVGDLRKLKIPPDTKVAKAFGTPGRWKRRKRQ